MYILKLLETQDILSSHWQTNAFNTELKPKHIRTYFLKYNKILPKLMKPVSNNDRRDIHHTHASENFEITIWP